MKAEVRKGRIREGVIRMLGSDALTSEQFDTVWAGIHTSAQRNVVARVSPVTGHPEQFGRIDFDEVCAACPDTPREIVRDVIFASLLAGGSPLWICGRAQSKTTGEFLVELDYDLSVDTLRRQIAAGMYGGPGEAEAAMIFFLSLGQEF